MIKNYFGWFLTQSMQLEIFWEIFYMEAVFYAGKPTTNYHFDRNFYGLPIYNGCVFLCFNQ